MAIDWRFRPDSVILPKVSYLEVIQRWRALPPEEQMRRRWDAIPRQVCASMAFEAEPVDLEWLANLHQMTPPPAGLKPAAASSSTPK